MRFFKIATAVCLITSQANADVLADLQTCKMEPDSLKRLTCFDKIDVPKPITEAPDTTASQPKKSPVSLSTYILRIRAKDPMKEVYNARVEFVPTFKNDTKKAIVAVEHTMVINDAFGVAVVNGKGQLDIKIPPGKTVQSDTFYFWEDNPFINDEKFDKLQGPVGTGVAKVTVTVTKVVFSDGSVESYE